MQKKDLAAPGYDVGIFTTPVLDCQNWGSPPSPPHLHNALIYSQKKTDRLKLKESRGQLQEITDYYLHRNDFLSAALFIW